MAGQRSGFGGRCTLRLSATTLNAVVECAKQLHEVVGADLDARFATLWTSTHGGQCTKNPTMASRRSEAPTASAGDDGVRQALQDGPGALNQFRRAAPETSAPVHYLGKGTLNPQLVRRTDCV